jgi:hypothetical protein
MVKEEILPKLWKEEKNKSRKAKQKQKQRVGKKNQIKASLFNLIINM